MHHDMQDDECTAD